MTIYNCTDNKNQSYIVIIFSSKYLENIAASILIIKFAKYRILKNLKQITINKITVIFQQISSAIFYIYSNNCIYRNIKLVSIFVISKLLIQTKISDFELINNKQLKICCNTDLFIALEIFYSVIVRLYNKTVDI